MKFDSSLAIDFERNRKVFEEFLRKINWDFGKGKKLRIKIQDVYIDDLFANLKKPI